MDPTISGMLIGIILTGILLGIWLDILYSRSASLSRDLKREKERNERISRDLTQAVQKNEQLASDLSQAIQEIEKTENSLSQLKQDKEKFVRELVQERAHIARLTRDVNRAHKDNENLIQSLNAAKQHNVGLTQDLNEAKQRNETLNRELEQERLRNEELEQELAQERQGSASLTRKLAHERQHTENLDRSLNQKRQHNESLTRSLARAEELNAQLSSNLTEVAQRNENALWLLHLAKLSLQECATLLQNERDGFMHLREEHRALEKHHRETLDTYRGFRDKIKEKAKRRLVWSAAKAAVVFIPGVALTTLLGDMLDIVDTIKNAEKVVAGLGDAASVSEVASEGVDAVEVSVGAAESSDVPAASEGGVDLKEDQEGVKTAVLDVYTPHELPSGAGTLLALTPEARRGVDEVLQEVALSSQPSDLSRLDIFVTEVLQRMMDLLDPLSEEERRAAIVASVNHLRQFGVQLFDYHKQPNAFVRESPSEKGGQRRGET